MVNVLTRYTPFRLKLSRKEPVQLSITLENKGNENKMISMEIKLSRHLSLDKGGFRTSESKKIENLGKGAKKQFYYEIWPKQSAMKGEQPVILTVSEHYNNFTHVAKQSVKSIPLTVET